MVSERRIFMRSPWNSILINCSIHVFMFEFVPAGKYSRAIAWRWRGTPKHTSVLTFIILRIDNIKGTLTIDLRDNPDNLPCGLNLTEATAKSGAMTGIFNSIDHTVPPNTGSFRCVNILLREGCIVGIPKHPYSCSLGTSNICDRLENAVVQAFAKLGEGWGMAECGPYCLLLLE